MTRQQIEQDIRKVQRFCTGPYILDGKTRFMLTDLWQRVNDARSWDAVVIYKRQLECACGMDASPIADGDWDGLSVYVTKLLHARTGCDFDVNNLILAQALDGKDKFTNCPKCGSRIEWVPAVYTETN